MIRTLSFIINLIIKLTNLTLEQDMKLFLILSSLVAGPLFAASGGDLNASDYVGVSFWLVTAALLASTVFFFIERDNVGDKWKTSLTIAGLVTGIAFWHYLYMRGVWIDTGETPTVFRYIDWLLTVPLLMVEFYLILKAVTDVAASLFWKLFVGSLAMLIFGYMGEAGLMSALPAFIIASLFWIYLIYTLWMGEGRSAVSTTSPSVQTAYNTMMWIIVVGWAIYPAGYVFGYLLGTVDASSLNLVYNLADFVNKILFGLVIWAAAIDDKQSAYG
jgi:bacteriorhodopsin